MENKEKDDKNWLSIMLITASALFLLFAIFYATGRMWSNSSAQNNNMTQPQNTNNNLTLNNNSTENTTPDNSNTNHNVTPTPTTQSVNAYDNVTSLEIDSLPYSLVLKYDDIEKVQVECNNVLSNYKANLENDGTLHLKNGTFFNENKNLGNTNSNNNESTGSIIITLPKNLTLRECDINGGTGVINISDLIADDFDLDCGSGNVVLENVTLRDTDIDCHTGLVDISGSLSGETDIECSSGSLNLRLTDYNDNYNIKVKKGTGELIVNGETLNTFTLTPSNPSNMNFLEIEGSSGNINIDF